MKNHNLLSSFQSAFRGLKEVLIKESGFKYIFIIAVLVVILAFLLSFSNTEKLILIATCFTVLLLDLINSAIERFLDYLQPKYNTKIKEIKDILSTIVLIGCIFAVIIGIVILGPYITKL